MERAEGENIFSPLGTFSFHSGSHLGNRERDDARTVNSEVLCLSVKSNPPRPPPPPQVAVPPGGGQEGGGGEEVVACQ